MRLTAREIAQVRALGLYITEKCDKCGKVLNQTFRYTIVGQPEIYCSALCRDSVFFADRREVRKRASPGKCAYCGNPLEGKRRGTAFCGDKCRKSLARSGNPDAHLIENAATRNIADSDLIKPTSYSRKNRRVGQRPVQAPPDAKNRLETPSAGGVNDN